MEEGSKACCVCGEVGSKLLRCACKGDFYCGTQCQAGDWKRHKKRCTIELGRKLKEIHKESGKDAERVAAVHRTLGLIHSDFQRWAEAVQPLKEALRIYQLVPQTKDWVVCDIQVCLAASYLSMGQYEQALTIHKDVLCQRRAWFSNTHPQVADSI